MANEIQTKFDSEQSFSITLNATTLASGSGRASASVSNSNNRHSGIISVQVTTGGTAPTAGRVYSVYLLRDVGTIASDGWGGTDSDFDNPINAHLLGQIEVTASTNSAFYGEWDTEDLGALGPNFGIAIINDTDQAAASSGHAAYYRLKVPEVQ